MSALPCVACGRALEDAFPDDAGNQPYAGTAFSTGGHYGSTVFDPMDDTALEINVCDGCLVRAGVAGRVLHHGYRRGRRCATSWAKQASAIEAREGGDATEIAAPFTSGAVGEAETPKDSRSRSNP